MPVTAKNYAEEQLLPISKESVPTPIEKCLGKFLNYQEIKLSLTALKALSFAPSDDEIDPFKAYNSALLNYFKQLNLPYKSLKSAICDVVESDLEDILTGKSSEDLLSKLDDFLEFNCEEYEYFNLGIIPLYESDTMIFWGVLRFDFANGLILHTGVSSFKHNLNPSNSDLVPAIGDDCCFNIWMLNYSFADLPKTDYLINSEVIDFLESRKQDLLFFIAETNIRFVTENVSFIDNKTGKKVPLFKRLTDSPSSTETAILIEQF